MGRALILGCLLSLGGCHLIFPFNAAAPPGDAGGATDGPGGEARPLDGWPGCDPPGYKALPIRHNAAGDWALALEPGTTYTPLTINGAAPLDAAAAADYNQSNVQVAGFIVSRKAGGSVDEVLAGLKKSISGAFTVQLISGGRSTTTHDGHPAVVQTTFRIDYAGATPLSELRDTILTAALQKSSVTGLPAAWGASSTGFLLRLSTVLRGGRAIFVGAVTEAAADADNARLTRVVARDLTSTTGLARQGRATRGGCLSRVIKQPLAPVEIIWVMDESGSMTVERANIAQNAASFFAQAKSAGLDFRMGVTNVCAPGNPGCVQGKLCSEAHTDPSHMGGVDRFLLPSEQGIFEACINNPPGWEGAFEHGLDAARQAMQRHLPRTAATPAKIRPEAQVVIITVTDEAPNELFNVISGEYGACTLSPPIQASVNSAIQPYLDYLRGGSNAQAAVSAYHVIGGTCFNSCSASVGHGYRELAAAFGGTFSDICASDLGPAITAIIGAIKAAASAVAVQGAPISASLRLTLNGQIIPRSPSSGFDHLPLKDAIQFTGAITPQTGDTLRVSYTRWN